MDTFEVYAPTRVMFGRGSVTRLPEAVSGLGKKALLFTYGDDSMRASGTLDKVTDLLVQAGVSVTVDEGVEPNPDSEYVDRMSQSARKEDYSFVIGLGGGSAIDVAKAVAIVSVNKTSVLEYLPGGKNPFMEGVKNALPIVAIPTTAGTGSEVTHIAVISDRRHHYKPGMVHSSLYPTVSIVDPELMLTVPPGVTASTGADVLFHAMEAYISRGANPWTDMIAREAIRLTVENLEKAYRNGSDIKARTNMAWACTLAGIPLDQANVVAIHALGQGISGHTNAAHGSTMAALGPAYLRYTYKANPARYAQVAEWLGEPRDGSSDMELAEKSSETLRKFLARVDLDITASSLGVTEEMIPAIAKEAFLLLQPLMDCCLVELSEKDAQEIVRMSM
ncbi:MAG: iron-containing alcohol dehydrogenase [Actinobacteria bacterium]|nr:iron-containing alcohol dehydrogenase [Actinomycetota bacterium]